MRRETGRRWVLCENSKIFLSTGNLQNFMVDIFNYFYSTLCRTFREPLRCFRYSGWFNNWMSQNTSEITGWQELVGEFSEREENFAQVTEFTRCKTENFSPRFFCVNYFQNRLYQASEASVLNWKASTCMFARPRDEAFWGGVCAAKRVAIGWRWYDYAEVSFPVVHHLLVVTSTRNSSMFEVLR